MLLQDKTAVVYGAAGKIGSAVSRAFANEGAQVFLAGRSAEPLHRLASELGAQATTVDACNEADVEAHLDDVMASAGRIDIVVNAVSIRGDLQGTSLLDMPIADALAPAVAGITANLTTARAAARRMRGNGSGVILTLSSTSSGLSGRDRVFHKTGGFGVGCAAVEALSRSLAGELGPLGIRVVCLRSDALPETWPADEDGIADIRRYMEQGTALGRLPTLAQVADAAVFAASDRASAMTGAILNLTCGSIMDVT